MLDVTLEGVARGRLEPVELEGARRGGMAGGAGDGADVVAGAARISVPARTGLVLRLADR